MKENIIYYARIKLKHNDRIKVFEWPISLRTKERIISKLSKKMGSKIPLPYEIKILFELGKHYEQNKTTEQEESEKTKAA